MLKDDSPIVSIKSKEHIFASFLLIIILLIFFNKSLLPNRVLTAAGGVFSTPFFSEVKPSGYVNPPNATLFDQVYQFTPWRKFTWENLRQGNLPLWNPYSYAGTPFIATMQSAVFYPINLLLTFLPFQYALVWSAFLRLLIAGISTYILMRYYRVGYIGSLISATSFMLSGFLIVWLGHPHTNVAIWLPTLILLAEILLQATQKDKILATMAFLAFVIGFQFMGGHVETSVDILFTFGLYYLVRWVMVVLPQKRPITSKLEYLFLFPGISILLGTAIAAISLAPFLEWLPLSAEFQKRGGGMVHFYIDITNSWHRLFQLPLILFPNLYNNPTWNQYPYLSFSPFGTSYLDDVLYVGTITLLLSLIGILVRWKSESLVKTWAFIGLILFGRVFYLPVFDWINQLPILNFAGGGRLRFAFSFALCILSGFGVQPLLNIARDKLAEKIWIWGSVATIVIGLIIMMAGNTILPAVREQITDYGRGRVDNELASRTTPPQQDLEYYYAQVDQMVSGLLAAFRFDNFAMYMPVLWALIGLFLLLWYRRNGPSQAGRLEAALFILVVFDLINFGKNFNPSIPVSQFYPATSVVKKIGSDKTLFRFTALRQDLIPDAQIMFHLQDIRGLDYPTYWYNEYMNLVPDRIPWLNYGMIFSSVDSPLLTVLNIKYVAASKPDMLEANPNIRLVGKMGEIYLGEMINVSPRAFMVYDAVLASDDENAAEVLRNDPESIFKRVVLSDVKDNPLLMTEQSNDLNFANNVKLIEYKASDSIWQVSTDGDGLLFLSDAYYPGWKVYLDNRPVELYRANIAFRAVYVPKGDHMISFRYEPVSLLAGTVISVVSIITVFVLLVLSYRYASKPKIVEGYIADDK